MIARIASFAVLAALCACGKESAPAAPAAKSPTSKSTAQAPPAKVEPSKVVTEKPKPTPAAPTEKPASTDGYLEKPTESSTAKSTPPKPAAPIPAPLPVPEEDNAPGIVAGAKPSSPPETDLASTMPASADRAVAKIVAASGSTVAGTVTFAQMAAGVEVHVVLEGLPPGEHGLHVHEKGDCSGNDGLAAGDHFNPGNAPHGGREAGVRHAGDLGNVTADATGRVDVTFTDTHIALSGATSVLGRAIVVHADPDDGMSQPAGNSGARIACGVIEASKTEGSLIGG